MYSSIAEYIILDWVVFDHGAAFCLRYYATPEFFGACPVTANYCRFLAINEYEINNQNHLLLL